MIRAASKEDIAAIMTMSPGFLAESRWAHVPYSPQRWEQHLAFCQDKGFLWVHEVEGLVDAFMAGVAGPLMFSDSLYAAEIALYVLPDKRTGFAAVVLVKKFIDWARARNCIECVAGSSASINVYEVRRIYEHCGFQFVGDLMVRRL